MKRVWIAGLAAAIGMAVLVPGTARASTTDPGKGIWLVSTSNDSLSDTLDRAVSDYGKDAVLDELEILKPAAEHGSLKMLDHAESVPVPASELDALTDSVSDGGSIAPAFAESWPIRGAKGSGSTYWTGMKLAVALALCSGSCSDTDRLTINSVTTNPGAVGSTFSYTMLYSPNNGNLTGNFVRTYALCGGATDCGHVDTAGTGGKTGTIYSLTAQNGKKLRHGHQLFGHYPGGTITDQAKTGLATCNTSNNVCKY